MGVGMLLNCGGDILINMGAVAAMSIKRGENPLVTIQWVMGGATEYAGRDASLIIEKLDSELPPPEKSDSGKRKVDLLRGM